MLQGWSSDVRYALRSISRSPLFTAVAVVSLAIGIGANSTIFSIANGLLFRPRAGLLDPDQLVEVGRSRHGNGFDNASYPNFLDLRARNTVFTDIAAYRIEPRPYSLGNANGVERVYGTTVTSNYFSVFGTRPAVGRLFTDADNRVGAGDHVVVLSYATWQRRFGGDPAIVGRTITLNSEAFAVLGVAPDGFQGTGLLVPDLWVPIQSTFPLLTERRAVWLVMVARLQPGVTLDQARANVDAVAAGLAHEYPDANKDSGFAIAPSSRVPGPFAVPVKAFLAFLMTIVGLVLIVACVNLAGMLLARAATRRREIAIRLSLGAGRVRLVRQLVTESVLLFLLAGVAGLLLSVWMRRMLLALIPSLPVPIDLDLPTDWRVVGFTAALSLTAGLLSGLVPALQTASPSILPALQRDGGDVVLARLRFRSVLVVLQVAVSVVVLLVAGLFVRSLQNAASMNPGFDPNDLEVVSLELSIGGFTPSTGTLFHDHMLERAKALPGVRQAAWSRVLPLTGGGFSLGGLLKDEEAWPTDGFGGHSADWNVVSPEYFNALEIPILRGRGFTRDDRSDGPAVMIVNETLARQFWPSEDPIGKRIYAVNPSGRREFRVVGIARDSKYRSLGDDARLFVYVPLAQNYLPDVDLVLRTPRGRSVLGEARALVRELAPTLPVVNAMSYGEYVALGLTPQRVATALAGTLGLVGLVLAAIGLYGVTAYSVARRTREIGVRLALGADRADVMRMVLRQAIVLGLSGLAVGATVSLIATRALSSLLFGVTPADPITFASIAGLFALVTMAASWIPARRAMTIDPVQALRCE